MRSVEPPASKTKGKVCWNCIYWWRNRSEKHKQTDKMFSTCDQDGEGTKYNHTCGFFSRAANVKEAAE